MSSGDKCGSGAKESGRLTNGIPGTAAEQLSARIRRSTHLQTRPAPFTSNFPQFSNLAPTGTEYDNMIIPQYGHNCNIETPKALPKTWRSGPSMPSHRITLYEQYPISTWLFSSWPAVFKPFTFSTIVYCIAISGRLSNRPTRVEDTQPHKMRLQVTSQVVTSLHANLKSLGVHFRNSWNYRSD
jgi:hypothetical protein